MKLRDYFEGWLSAEDLRDASNRQAIYGGSLDTALLELEVLSPPELMAALRVARGLESTPVELLTPGLPRPWEEMPDAWLLARDAVPLGVRGGRLWIAIHPDLSEERLTALQKALPDAVVTVTASACIQQIAEERRGQVVARDRVLTTSIVDALRAADSGVTDAAPPPAVDPGDSDVTITIVDDSPEESTLRPGFTATVIPSLTRAEASPADSAEFDVAVDDPEFEGPREDAAPAVIPRLKRIDSSLYVAAEPQAQAPAPEGVAEIAAPAEITSVIPSLTRGDAAPASAAAGPGDAEAAASAPEEGANSRAAAEEIMPSRGISGEPTQASEHAHASAPPPASTPAPASTSAPASTPAPAPENPGPAAAPEFMPVIPTLKRPAAAVESAPPAATLTAAASTPASIPTTLAATATTPTATAQASIPATLAPPAATSPVTASPASPTIHQAIPSPTPGAPSPVPAPAPTPSPASAPVAEADAPVPRARPERSGFVPTTLLQSRPPSDRHEEAASLDTQLHAALTSGGRREAMIERLRQLGEPAYAKIAEIFPGPLDLPRGDLKNLPPPSAHGPLLRLCIILGDAIAPSILPRLRDANANTRFYAALVFQELRSPTCVGPLADLAFDDDRDVRTIAMRVLESYQGAPGHARAVQRIRGELNHADAARRRQAIQAMGTLRDVLAIPRLIDALDEDDLEIRAAALTSLCAITGQHLGMAAAPWRAWLVAHGRMSRGEWMLQSLSHGDAAVRRWAAEELVRTTGQRIPFDPRGSEAERAEAIARWRAWIAEHPTPGVSTSG